MAKDFSFEDITTGGGEAAPVAAPPKDFLVSLIEFVNRAITLASEINALISNAKTNLVPLIAQKVKSEMTPSGPGQNVAPAAPTDPEGIYKQILEGLENLLKTMGDLPLSEIIAKMKNNKEMVITAIKVKLQAGADGGPPK